MKKVYTVNYSMVLQFETILEAESEQDAKKKFKAVMPFEKIVSVWEVKERKENV